MARSTDDRNASIFVAMEWFVGPPHLFQGCEVKSHFRVLMTHMNGLPSRRFMKPFESRRTTDRRTESLSLPPMQNAKPPWVSCPISTTMTEWET